jgi:DNA-binding NtrC family response regulator
MKAAILIIGEDGVLSYSRAQILKDCWETATAKEADAQVVLHARPYDLLVLSQTVPDAAVKEITASAVKLSPEVKFLLISEEEQQRPFGCATFTAEIFKPERLRQKVAGLLDGNDRDVEPSL